MTTGDTLLALDVGTRRIGVARADTSTRLAFAIDTIAVDGQELSALRRLIDDVKPAKLVIGYPRNQSGDPTQQTELVVQFAKQLESLGIPLVFQDESLTSVEAERRLTSHGKPYSKADIDAEAAAIILQDYIEAYHGY